jgi:hypothetical protein
MAEKTPVPKFIFERTPRMARAIRPRNRSEDAHKKAYLILNMKEELQDVYWSKEDHLKPKTAVFTGSWFSDEPARRVGQ